jgi:hypothetical protein
MGRMVPEKQNALIREVFVGKYRLIYLYKLSVVSLLTIKHMASKLSDI